ncbi:EpsI family protein [Bryocella elongata]|uniref:EpsI family protein n=1 Tax=Bryocella elongata TaxID=863522 RepID=A0A1H5XQD1_9BACT|nr:exosortase C-terminal domain/associated protein EpsI [Bryocella elongata]SEG13882.1 EpsI family protein [Bryocella elongata]
MNNGGMFRTPIYWSVMGLMLAVLGLLVARGNQDRVPPSTALDQFPVMLAGLNSTEVPLAQEALDVLGKGYFLNRLYNAPSATTPQRDTIGLFIAYFPTQRSGQSIHSPQNCLPGAGWTFLSSDTTTIPGPNGTSHQVGDYLISDGSHQAEVLYWYKAEKRWIANDWAAKYYMLLDSMRFGRTDAALVRITTMIHPGEDRAQARQRVVAFADALSPLLPSYVPD